MGQGEAGVNEGNISQDFHISRFHGPRVLGQKRTDNKKQQKEMDCWQMREINM